MPWNPTKGRAVFEKTVEIHRDRLWYLGGRGGRGPTRPNETRQSMREALKLSAWGEEQTGRVLQSSATLRIMKMPRPQGEEKEINRKARHNWRKLSIVVVKGNRSN